MVLGTVFIALMTPGAWAVEPTWRENVDQVQKLAHEHESRVDCQLLSSSHPWLATLVQRSDQVLAEAGRYGRSGNGEGKGHLDADAEQDQNYDCTTAVEAVVSNGSLERLHAIRYLPGWEGRFFGRAHYYETLWRPNALARRILKDVTSCVEGASSYEYELNADMWDGMLTGNLKNQKLGKTFLQARLGHLPKSCSRSQQTLQALGLDWSTDEGASLSCHGKSARLATRASLRKLVEEIEVQTTQDLHDSPILTSTPWVPIRGSEGQLIFNPETQLPARWNQEGQILFVAFIATKPNPAFSHNEHYVRHQGTLIRTQNRWWLRHSSSERIHETKGMTQVLFKDYLEGMSSIVGINLLAPIEP